MPQVCVMMKKIVCNDGENSDKEDPIAIRDGYNEEDNAESANKTTIDSKDKEEDEPSTNNVLRKLLRVARYFDPPDAGLMTCCYSCGEQGHIAVHCPAPPTKRRTKPCFICGSLLHVAKQCSKGYDCYICRKGGHRAKDCPDKYKNGSKERDVCLRCGDFGHDMILCKYDYSRDDLKDIQCYVCKSFGHLCCVEPDNAPLWSVSCYRCGQLGHIGLACGRHYEEITEKDSASACFKCGEGHFSRKCPNLLSIRTSQGRVSPSLRNKSDEAGYLVRASEVFKRDRETSTPPSRKSRKKKKENSEHNSTFHQPNEERKKFKNNENLDCNSTAHESNKKSKKNTRNLEHNSTPEGEAKKKNRDNSEHDSSPYGEKKNPKNPEHNLATPLEPNGITKKKKRRQKKTHRGEHPQNTQHNPNQRASSITEEDHVHREYIKRPRSPIIMSQRSLRSHVTPSDHYHHRLSITPSGHYHHSLPISTPSSHNHHRSPSTDMSYNRRSPTLSSAGHYPFTQSTIPYDMNLRDSSFESSGHHLSGPLQSRWHSSHHHYYHRQEHNRYAFLESQSTIPYGVNHRNSSFESTCHPSSGPPSRWQPYYPSFHHNHDHHHYQDHHRYQEHHRHQEHHHYQELHRHQEQLIYAPAPSRYGPAYQYGEYRGNYDRW
ncbi:unnamed protein product [Cochlearia groenlandica]